MTANARSEQAFSPKVGVARLPSCSYPSPEPAEAQPSGTAVSQALRRLAGTMDWSEAKDRSPFSKVIPPGARVLVKPNLVLHENEGPGGLDCLLTHFSVIRAVVDAALQTDAAEVLVGDAPIQGCNFDVLVEATGLGNWAQSLKAKDPRFQGVRDFRRTIATLVHGVRVASEGVQSEDRFLLFDLGRHSLLEPISETGNRFRVAWYDPRLMARTHHPGVHQYLVAKEVIDADVIINVPKLKTHRKAGITCALKNLIGINGNKEYLPHHRLGGSESGGDCYPGNGFVKHALEYLSDRQNLTSSYAAGMLWRLLFAVFARTSRAQGDRTGTDGSWSGNDTIWRTCLDLNRILLYGQADATLSSDIQRRVIHIADAVVAGQGNGPLAPDPLPLGLLLGANNAAAMDWVGAILLAYDPARISLVCHAFDLFPWPITDTPSSGVTVVGDLGEGDPRTVLDTVRQPVVHPVGWLDVSADLPPGQSGPHPDSNEVPYAAPGQSDG
ncbi:MAG: DUF362 domain-containing protein [Terriglobales bacterium]|jgi:uncharacterized protein (DUF362 family)